MGLQLFKRPKRFRRADALQERFCTMVGLFMLLTAVLVVAQHGPGWYERSVLPSYVELVTDYKRRHVAFMTAILGPWVVLVGTWGRPVAETGREVGGYSMLTFNYNFTLPLPW